MISLTDYQRSKHHENLLDTVKINLESDYDFELTEDQIQTICNLFYLIIQKPIAESEEEPLGWIEEKVEDKLVIAGIEWLMAERFDKYHPDNPVNAVRNSPVREVVPVPISHPNQLKPSRLLDKINKVFFSTIDYSIPVEITKGERSLPFWLEGKRLKCKRKRVIDTLWLSEKTKDDRYIWRSDHQIDKVDVENLVRFLVKRRDDLMPSIHLNSGTHGNRLGQGVEGGNKELADLRIKEENEQSIALACEKEGIDAALAKNKFSIHVVSTYSSHIYPTEADHVIDTLCSGANSPIYQGENGLEEDLNFLSDIGRNKKVLDKEKLMLSYFGLSDWGKLLYLPVEKEKELESEEILQILGQPCPYFKDKMVYETHILFYLPKEINLNYLNEILIENEIKDEKSWLTCKNKEIDFYLNESSNQSYYALLTKETIPESDYSALSDQEKLIREDYGVPTVLELVIGSILHYVKTDQRLYSYGYSRCKEVFKSDFSLVVGFFGKKGIRITTNRKEEAYENQGLSVVRKIYRSLFKKRRFSKFMCGLSDRYREVSCE
ncbi:MAG: hypothetical protein AAGE99_02040 [Chlamydiota bacterium]